jgi:2-methylcitrate dehydratase PrpD
MARLGTALGWPHYSAGWHATCTAGAPGAAVTAAVARGLDADATARAIVLAIPGAGGVQRAFGTAGKSLQVGFAAEAGVRAAALAAAGASADAAALEQWMSLVGGDPGALDLGGPAVPGGLAIKPFPCCYALQRPIAAVAGLSARPSADRIRRIAVRTPAASLAPLIHHSPQTGLEGKFSLEYGIAAALLDGAPGLASFSDAAVQRTDAMRLAGTVHAAASDDGGDHLLTGEVEIELELLDGERMSTTLALPPGAPERPMTDGELTAKLELCGAGDLAGLSWGSAAQALRQI